MIDAGVEELSSYELDEPNEGDELDDDEDEDDELDEGEWEYGPPGRWCVVWAVKKNQPPRNGRPREPIEAAKWAWHDAIDKAQAAADALADLGLDPIIVDLAKRAPRARWHPSDAWARSMRNPDRGASLHDYLESARRGADTKAENARLGRMPGVTWNAGRQAWSTAVRHQGRVRYLGVFAEYEDAAATVMAFKAEPTL